MILDGGFQCVDAGFERFLVLDDVVQLGRYRIDQKANTGNAAAGKQYD